MNLFTAIVAFAALNYFDQELLHTETWWMAFFHLIKTGQLLWLCIHLLVTPWAILNRTLIVLEEFLVPKLQRIDFEFFQTPNKLVFVLGHPRSGTTNTQKSLSSINDCIWETYFDVVFPSLTLKYLFYPLFQIFNYLLFSLCFSGGQANHKMDMFEQLEEHMVCWYYWAGVVFAPGLLSSLRVSKELVKAGIDLGTGEPHQMDFIKRCMTRAIYFRGYNPKTTVYTGGPIDFCSVAPKLRAAFPYAKFIFCVRNPEESFPSLVEFHSSINPRNRHDPFTKELRIHYFYEYSCKLYRNMADWAKQDDPLSYWQDFDDWKRDAKSAIERVWRFLDFPFESHESDVALIRSESHKNQQSSFELVPPETIRRELGETYLALKEKCRLQLQK